MVTIVVVVSVVTAVVGSAVLRRMLSKVLAGFASWSPWQLESMQ